MYYILSILAGVVISVMVSLNGGLTASYGTYSAAVIIHIVGVIFAASICVLRKKHIKIKRQAPLWAYLGGAIGVLTTLFNNYAYGRVTITSIVALGLLGQSITSVILDSFGWLGVKKRRTNRSAVVGYLTAIIGIFVMMDNSVSEAALAVVLSLSSGITVVLSRTVNSRLATETSPLVGSFINHLVGLPICIVLALCLQHPVWLMASGTKPWMYLGGALGVVTVLLFNITVPRESAFRLTLLSFVGQIFTGITLDLTLGLECSTSTFAGGLIIATGLLANMMLEYWNNYRIRKKNSIEAVPEWQK
ncbi:MAG: DMT family transporter [Lachnospiraceae bacterium]|nr:DMT family transporter [Lachnospiraceae bacterium]